MGPDGAHPTASRRGSLRHPCLALLLTACGTSEPGDENRRPELEAPSTVEAREGRSLVIAIRATDPDDDLVQLSAQPLPAGASFDPESGLLAWTPGFDAARAEPYLVTFTAEDGHHTVQAATSITVLDANRRPALLLPGPQSAVQGSLLSFAVGATDPDGDAVTVAAPDPPQGATFDGRTFAWIPSAAQIGLRQVSFVATDSHPGSPPESATEALEITVRAPAGQPLGDFFDDGDYTGDPAWTVSAGSWAVANGALEEQVSDGQTATIELGSAVAYGSWSWLWRIPPCPANASLTMRFVNDGDHFYAVRYMSVGEGPGCGSYYQITKSTPATTAAVASKLAHAGGLEDFRVERQVDGTMKFYTDVIRLVATHGDEAIVRSEKIVIEAIDFGAASMAVDEVQVVAY